MIGREAEPGAKVVADRPGLSNSASPSEVGCERASSAPETTVTVENRSVTTGRTPTGSAGFGAGPAAPGPAFRAGLSETTLISSRATSSAWIGDTTKPAMPIPANDPNHGPSP